MEIKMFKDSIIANACFEKVFIPYFISESSWIRINKRSDFESILYADIKINESPRYKKDVEIEIARRSSLITISFYLKEKESITNISYTEIELIKNIEKYFETLKEMATKFEEEYNNCQSKENLK